MYCLLCGARPAKKSRRQLCQRHLDLMYYVDLAIEERVAAMPLYSSVVSETTIHAAADL